MPRPPRVVLLALAAVACAPAAPAEARRRPAKAPRLLALRCIPVGSARCAHGPAVPIGLQVQLRGGPFYNGMRVTFRWSRGAIATTLRRTHVGWTVRVPASVRPGRVWVYVRDRHHRR
jgi:hypothetical protein